MTEPDAAAHPPTHPTRHLPRQMQALLRTTETDLADGEWHHLHPLTPLLRGGIFVIAILGIVIANLRERIIQMFVGTVNINGREINPNDWGQDPVDIVVKTGTVGWVLLGLAVLLVILGIGFYLSWRFHTFRITEEVVEVRSGVLFRTHRNARLDRIQGVNVNRPLIPRLVGAAKLEVSVAGQNANVQLVYLGSKLADGLRRDILHLASGASGARHAPDAAMLASGTGAEAGTVVGAVSAVGGMLESSVNEFLTPEYERGDVAPESLVRIPAGRLLGSIALSPATVIALVLVVGSIVAVAFGYFWALFTLVPVVIGTGGYAWSRFTKSLRYTIVRTPDGVRIGHGLLSTSSETIPPGRVHAIEVSQPLLWRPSKWWTIRINTAGQLSSSSAGGGSAAAQRAIVLPVGAIGDVEKVLGLILPGFEDPELRSLVRPGLIDDGRDPRFTTSPRRARWLRPFSWRRTGFVFGGGTVLLRRGVITRSLILVPLARLQSVSIQRGPLRRMLRLRTASLHTVAGPVGATLPAVDLDVAERFVEQVARSAVAEAAADATAHWRREAEPAIQAPVHEIHSTNNEVEQS